MKFNETSIRQILTEEEFDRINVVNSTYNYIDINGKVDARILKKLQDEFGHISCIDNADNATTIPENHSRIWFHIDLKSTLDGLVKDIIPTDSGSDNTTLAEDIINLVNNDEIDISLEDTDTLIETIEDNGYSVDVMYKVE